MRYVNDYAQALQIFTALGSDIRLHALELLRKNGRMSMNELAKELGITNGALTPHIRRLESSRLIRIVSDPALHGNQKMIEAKDEKIMIAFRTSHGDNCFHSHLRAGQYSSFEVYPTCGLSTASHIVGEVDDPRYFSHAARFEADILWFTKGYVEYLVPCVIPASRRITRISFSAEMSSEAPGSNPNWPSDIHFYYNGILVGVWTSPGDYADVQGTFTPDWWYANWNQYGLLKALTVNEEGTFLDNVRISDVTIRQLNLSPQRPIFFRVAVPDTAKNIGGLTIFGRDFGNYNQDIAFLIEYS